jgi:hypothetical protein
MPFYRIRRCTCCGKRRTSRSEGCIPLSAESLRNVRVCLQILVRRGARRARAQSPSRAQRSGSCQPRGSLAKLDHRGRISWPNRRLARGRGMTTILLLLRRFCCCRGDRRSSDVPRGAGQTLQAAPSAAAAAAGTSGSGCPLGPSRPPQRPYAKHAMRISPQGLAPVRLERAGDVRPGACDCRPTTTPAHRLACASGSARCDFRRGAMA